MKTIRNIAYKAFHPTFVILTMIAVLFITLMTTTTVNATPDNPVNPEWGERLEMEEGKKKCPTHNQVTRLVNGKL